MFYQQQTPKKKGITRSPVYAFVSTSLDGLALIRAFSAQDRFLKEFLNLQNQNTAMFFSFATASRWLGFRLDMLASVFLGFVAFLSVLLKGNLSPALVGLMLSYSLQFIGLCQWAARQSAEVENLMTSTERILHYTNLPSEAPPVIDNSRPPPDWPNRGEVIINNLSLSYPSAPNISVLKNLNLHLIGGEKVGIVGRTGAGVSAYYFFFVKRVFFFPPYLFITVTVIPLASPFFLFASL